MATAFDGTIGMFLKPQQLMLNSDILQFANSNAERQVPQVFPVKQLAFNRINLSKALWNINKPGPVITGSSPAYYNDRYEQNKKWYFPCFSLQQPLQNSFLFTTWISGPNADGNQAYGGEVSFVLKKDIPAEVISGIQNLPEFSFHEILYTNLSFSFLVTTVDKQVISFPCSFVQKDDTVTLTIRLDMQDGLIRFYKFIANAANKNFCSIEIKATYFAYTQKPFFPLAIISREKARSPILGIAASRIINAGRPRTLQAVWMNRQVQNDTTTQEREYITNNSMSFTTSIQNVCFDCRDFTSNYLLKTSDNNIIIFGCTPPFCQDGLSKNDYTKLSIINGSLEGTGISTVYIDKNNGSCLLIPVNYYIALDESEGDILIPAAYLFTTIDVNNVSNSTATFKFNIAPNVTGFQLLKLKKLLQRNLPNQLQKHLSEIHIRFPSVVWQPENIQFNKQQIPYTDITHIGAYVHGVEGSNLFRLEFQNVSIGNANAATIASILKDPNGKMFETIAFAVDSDTEPNPQSSIILSLENISGSGLDIQPGDNGEVYLINKTLFDISASGIADKDDEPKNLNPSVLIPNNNAVKTTSIDDVAEINSTEFEYTFNINEIYTDRILKEIRIDAGQEVKDTIVITNNTGLFNIYHIERIDISLSIFNPDDPDLSRALYTTNTIELTVDGDITFIDFMLPVANYLSKWSIIYLTTIHFTNAVVQQNEPKQINDINSIGKIVNLTASNLDLAR